MKKILFILVICAFSFIPFSAQAIRKTTCTKERYFKALVTKDPHTKKGSVNTFSKTNAGDF